MFALFLMIPGIVLLHFFGFWAAVTTILLVTFLLVLYVMKRVWQGEASLRQLLFADLDTGWQLHPMLTILAGLVFAGGGLWIIVKAREIGAPDPGRTEMTGIEQCWFGATFVMMGFGIVGFGLSSNRRGGPT